ncbi:MAG TPA: ATP-binding protein [Bacteroidia bacterium]|jgi:PAS domain S-box-containing protein
MLEAIKDGGIDALILTKEGKPNIYSIESADYTYRILIEKFGEGAISISEDGLILYCNDYFSKLIGLPTNHIIGTYFNSYIDSVGQFQELKSALKDGPSKGEMILNADGIKVPVYASLTDLHPQVPAIGIIVTDLTLKRQHEEDLALYQRKLEVKINELNQTNINLEQFIHVISHDIKEPLRKIVAYTSYLTESKNTLDENQIKKLKIVSSSALRLNALVDDLVKYAFNSIKEEPSDVDLNIILREVQEDLSLVISESFANITIHNLPKIKGSRVQMRQLFLNLLSNAIKYKKANKNPEIEVSHEVENYVDLSFPEKKFHKISVRDNGIGMDKNHIAKIFTIFQRLHLPGEYTGNGIGLAISKKIMENHLGKIKVESTINDGSTFNLYFPLVKTSND